MSTKLPWTRLFSSQWIVDVSGMSIVEKGLYMTLVLYMYEERRPIIEDAPKLARWAGCSVRVLKNTLDILLRDEKIIRLEDGRLWSLRVEEELNNSNDNLNKFSERAQKAAQAKWAKYHNAKTISDDQDAKHDANGMLNDAKHDALSNANSNAQAMLNYAINNNINNNNIYKKTKTIVLAKKEIGSESLETTNLIQEPTEVAAVDSQSEQIETLETNQPIIHEQESVPKKAKRSKGKKELGSVPEDFEPDLQYAIDKGLTHDEALLEFERFKLHWKANPCRNANNRDWQSAWCGWIINQNGTLAKKLEQEKRYANERYKLSTNNFTNSLSQSFSTLKAAISTSDSYGSECSRDTEAISSFASTFQESGPECVSSNLYVWKAVDAGGESASFARL
ncbi:Uncharacterized protein conserved in bacteria [Bartonella grahamii]|uniref:Uncharacterized protein conserved in bacteria n=1 Tax=Bartonella grahamii TaxID=33045 RepID=A0A336NI64_BARGR|nr:DUF1376 domain-containing protein [Bartonella grahamii]SSZ40478.1 Uncharacterized protein conserved in bacteria [Bartonella grahamii]